MSHLGSEPLESNSHSAGKTQTSPGEVSMFIALPCVGALLDVSDTNPNYRLLKALVNDRSYRFTHPPQNHTSLYC